ncbi:MAG TPA: DUF2917 domain-containing protein [Casimicrobiaceae bacterium]|nr:DUF2917 domain-containing protein [Casimicrobiaceae bacterium]
MACYESGTVISLANREAITLPDVRGATLRVTRGTLWLTEEHDHHDIVLRAGDNFVVEFDGDTVVEAQNDAVFCVVGNGTRALKLPQRAHRRSGLLDTLATLFRAPARPAPYF